MYVCNNIPYSTLRIYICVYKYIYIYIRIYVDMPRTKMIAFFRQSNCRYVLIYPLKIPDNPHPPPQKYTQMETEFQLNNHELGLPNCQTNPPKKAHKFHSPARSPYKTSKITKVPTYKYPKSALRQLVHGACHGAKAVEGDFSVHQFEAAGAVEVVASWNDHHTSWEWNPVLQWRNVVW